MEGTKSKGGQRMTWKGRLDRDMKERGLTAEMAKEWEKWRGDIMGKTSDPHKRRNNGR